MCGAGDKAGGTLPHAPERPERMESALALILRCASDALRHRRRAQRFAERLDLSKAENVGRNVWQSLSDSDS